VPTPLGIETWYKLLLLVCDGRFAEIYQFYLSIQIMQLQGRNDMEATISRSFKIDGCQQQGFDLTLVGASKHL
jgi:hypothetical protein